LEDWLDQIAPESRSYHHALEGQDDMPAHIKSSVIGYALHLPVQNGGLALGTWQGIYLCEYRNAGTRRSLILTLHGE
jgi:secondary thiamine-phosphate synthase enzyme